MQHAQLAPANDPDETFTTDATTNCRMVGSMTLFEAFQSGQALTIELTSDPQSVRRITRLAVEHGDLVAYDGQEADPWAVRPPTILCSIQGDGPVWTAGHLTIRAIND